MTAKFLKLPRFVKQFIGLGYYPFDNVEVGQIYILSVGSKRYSFTEPTRFVAVMEAMSGEDFVAEP